jgi:threonine/homoserine/homoserine lactone efflux protein
MRYVIIAIAIYLIYLLLRTFISGKAKKKPTGSGKNRSYDLDRIQEAEYKEVKKD